MQKHFVSNKDESVRMFDSDFLDFFSRVHWSAPLFIFVPVIIYFTLRGAYIYDLSALTIAGYFIAGLAFWTLAEYLLHRFVFHFHPKNPSLKALFWSIHGVHHDYPQDSKRLVMVPSLSIPLAALFYLIFLATFGAHAAAPFFAGFIAGYLAYDMTHYAIHHHHIRNKYLLGVKSHHMAHHYRNPRRGYGVSSDIWDRVFGTL